MADGAIRRFTGCMGEAKCMLVLSVRGLQLRLRFAQIASASSAEPYSRAGILLLTS